MTTDTIYALASAPGRGGVAVIRVSGPAAATSLRELTGILPEPRRAVFTAIGHPVGSRVIDRGLVIFFEGPASFTGENVVEYYVHGGRAVSAALLEALSQQPGHRLAEPGEFTRRAFENGKMDLTEAEAVADLVAAETEAQREQALLQMDGGLSRLYEGWCEKLTRALAHLEADIDFPDEDLPQGVASEVRPVLQLLISELESHLADYRRGERLRNGIQVAVVGAPNAGKSSLVNALARREAAIVSPHAGTTRDVIEVPLDLGGWPVILCDTAGLRPESLSNEGQEGIESEGIRRALARARDADLRLIVFDSSVAPDNHTKELIDDKSLVVLNKADSTGLKTGTFQNIGGIEGFAVSAKTGDGLPDLAAMIAQRVAILMEKGHTPPPTRARHRAALGECLESLHRALNATLPELAAEDVRLAVRALGKITGRVDVEDVLDLVFRDFCIGK